MSPEAIAVVCSELDANNAREDVIAELGEDACRPGFPLNDKEADWFYDFCIDPIITHVTVEYAEEYDRAVRRELEKPVRSATARRAFARDVWKAWE